MERLIYLNHLHPDVDVSALSFTFLNYGKILSASIEYDEHFNSLCKGQIFFQKPSDAKKALRIDREMLSRLGKTAFVYPATNKSNATVVLKTYTKIFVKNIDLDWDDCDLMKQFQKFGDVKDVTISMSGGKSNGYGFVYYKEHSSAKAAVEEMNNKVLSGKLLKVEPYLSKEEREELNSNSIDHAKNKLERSVQLNNLHVKNLPKNMSESDLKKLFDEFGEITSCKIASNDQGESRGFGFVAFKIEKEAETARFRMNGFSLNSHVLEVNFNQKKEDRQHYLNLIKSESAQANDVKKSQKQNYAKIPSKQNFKRNPLSRNLKKKESTDVLFSFTSNSRKY